MGLVIPALTLWQPWASLVAEGVKRYETRSWPAPDRLIGGPLAIHSAVRSVSSCGQREEWLMKAAHELGWDSSDSPFVPTSDMFLRELPRGFVVAIVEVLGCHRIVSAVPDHGVAVLAGFGSIDVDEWGDYSVGRWVWRLGRVWKLSDCPAGGRQRVWSYHLPPSVLENTSKDNRRMLDTLRR